jgi:hypothetical protein
VKDGRNFNIIGSIETCEIRGEKTNKFAEKKLKTPTILY